MKKNNSESTEIASLVWLFTNFFFITGSILYACIEMNDSTWELCFLFLLISSLASIPAGIVLLISIPFINYLNFSVRIKYVLLILVCFLCSIFYPLYFSSYEIWAGDELFKYISLSTLALFVPSLLAIAFIHKELNIYFLTTKNDNHGKETQEFIRMD